MSLTPTDVAEQSACGETLLGPGGDDPGQLLRRYRKAKDRRSVWEGHWQECYDYALPLRDGIFLGSTPGERKADRLFDGTAPDCVDQLAASLDRLGEVDLPDLAPGALLALGMTGAYGFSEARAPFLSHPVPREVWEP